MEEEKKPNNGRKKKILLAMFSAAALLVVVGLFIYVSYGKTHISTDDAYIEGRVYTIAAKVSGTVKQVHITDNQFVKKGDLLVEIDASDYSVRVNESSSALKAEQAKVGEKRQQVEVAKRKINELQYRIGSDKANLEVQKANLDQAERDLARAEELFKEELISKERYEKAKTSRDMAVAQVRAAEEDLNQAQSSIDTQKALIGEIESSVITQGSVVLQKQASLRAAQLNQDYTKIFSPSDGYVTKKSVEPGNQIQAGQPLMAVVPLDHDDIWIIANYKETQLERVRPGQTVRIKADTYPGKSFEGKVESIMAGTGSVFSLFPPENATGNFVKVVQRIPVKIILNKGADPEHVLRMGMSVRPTIFVGK